MGTRYLIKEWDQLTITNLKWTLSTDIKISLYREVVNGVHTYIEEAGAVLKKNFNAPRNVIVTHNLTLFEKEIATRVENENSVLMTKSKQISKRLNVVDALISSKQQSWGRQTRGIILAPMMGTV